MRKPITTLLALVLVFAPLVSICLNPADVEAKSTQKPCADGYFRSPLTNRCKKLVTVSESSSTITTTVYDPVTGLPTVTKACKSGYWWNASTGRCNKKKTCKIGYRYLSWNNTCEKIVCSFGFKVQDASNICKRIVCEKGHIINQKTGNCVKNTHGKYKTCKAGWTLDLRTLQCAKIGTKGSDDPASKKSQNLVVKYETKSTITLGSIVKLDDDSTSNSEEKVVIEKTCPEGKFLNPKTNRCKNLQEITENSTGKTITTYDPETGEGTTVKICNDGYFLNTETNRCNKVKEDSGTATSSIMKNAEKTCPEGKELNPETNRCRNIKKNDGAEYEIMVPELGDAKKFVAMGSVIAVILVGVVFIVFQFRKEILKFLKRLTPRKKP